jgi:hypothetical protein
VGRGLEVEVADLGLHAAADLGAEVGDGTAELVETAAHLGRDLRQAVRSEDDQRGHQQDEHPAEAEVVDHGVPY